MCILSKKIFIGVGDIYPDGQNTQIFGQFEQTKMAISRPFGILYGRNVTGFIRGLYLRHV